MGFLKKLFGMESEESAHDIDQHISPYLAGLLIVIDFEPADGRDKIIEHVLDSRCDATGNVKLKDAMDINTHITILCNGNLAHISNDEALILGLKYLQTEWQFPADKKDVWCQHPLGNHGWVLELWQKR